MITTSKQLHRRQYSSMSNANKAIRNFQKREPITLFSEYYMIVVNKLDEGCFEVEVIKERKD